MNCRTVLALALGASLLSAGYAGAQSPPPKPRVACAADIQKFCPNAASPKDARQCMKGHMAEASPGCQQAVQAAMAMRAEKKAAGSAPPSGQTPPPQ